MLTTMKEILVRAKELGYGVAAPNVDNEHNLRACIEAAEEQNAPLILGVTFTANPDICYFGRIATDLCIRARVPIAINLDHGASFEQAIWAIRAGFTSVMVDRSTLPYAENVAQVKEIVHIAHAVNVSVEAELGHVGVGENYAVDREASMTNPDQARQFVKETGVDCLAVAIGSAHGVYRGVPRLDFDRLDAIKAKVDVPLVLHGGSGTGDENLSKATANGICKVNLSNDLRRSSVEALNAVDLSGNAVYGMYTLLGNGYKAKLVHYMSVFGCAQRA